VANLPLPLNVQKLKVFQLQGDSPPDPLLSFHEERCIYQSL